MLTHIPLTIVTFIIYNVIMVTNDPYVWDSLLFALPMASGAAWFMRLSDIIISFGLFLLFFEIMKATRVGIRSVINHLLSTLVLVAFLVEFLLVPGAATSLFFILMVMALVDLMAGFSVSIRAAARDITMGNAPLN